MITHNLGPGNSVISPPKGTPLLQTLCAIFYRHWRKSLMIFFGSLALLVTALLLAPRTYTSEARLFLRLGKESVSLDPTATMNEVINVNESRESEINSELEIMRSRVLLDDVVERLGPDGVLAPEGNSSWVGTLLAGVKSAVKWHSAEISRKERAVHALAKSITVNSPRKSSVLLVTCKADDPGKAQRIVQTFVDAYVIRHAKANGTSGSHQFFSTQCALLGDQLKKTEDQLRHLKNQHSMASIDGQRTKVETQNNMIEVAILANQRDLSTGEERIVSLKKILSELPAQQLAEESTIPSAAVESMRSELYKLRIEESEARSRYSDIHPHVIARRQQVAEMQKILAAEESSRNQPTRRLNAVHQAMLTDLAATQASVATYRAAAAKLKQQSEEVQATIKALNDTEPRIKELTREAELIEASYRSYVANREQTRVGEALETGRISNVNVVQPASFAALPSSPNLKLMLALALVLATSASILGALVSEHLDRSLRTPEQAEQELGIPVFFSIPRGTRQELVGK